MPAVPPIERSMPPTTIAVVTPRPPIAITEAYLRTERSVVDRRNVSSEARKNASRKIVIAMTPYRTVSSRMRSTAGTVAAAAGVVPSRACIFRQSPTFAG